MKKQTVREILEHLCLGWDEGKDREVDQAEAQLKALPDGGEIFRIMRNYDEYADELTLKHYAKAISKRIGKE